MALNNFIPAVWAARLLENLHKAQVYTQPAVINRDFEGDIQSVGDTVKINSIGPVTVGSYTKNTNIGDPETLTDAQSILTIDQSKYFNFQVDDVDAAQTKPKVMDAAMREAAYALADATDQYVAGLYTQIDANNFIGTEGSPKTDMGTASVPYNYLVDLGVKLDENNVPRANRWVVIPPWCHGLLLKDARFVGYGTQANMDNLMNGEIGKAAGFAVFVSNNVPYTTTTTKFKIIAGGPLAWTFADQVNKVEAYRPEKRFADAVKGLHLYGAKVTRASGLAVLVANKA